MKIKHLIALALLVGLGSQGLWAKKVKFVVNMQGWTKSALGIHVTGDFQTVAGYAGGDWNSATTSMAIDGPDTNIYSVVVDIPAFTKYEYKFVNGDQFYEAEFVPIESRVGYNFNDNRWIYIDSLAPDTTVVGPLRFSGNAPMGMYLMRFLVDMHEEGSVSPQGAHVGGSFDGWAQRSRMYSFVTGIWEHIGYIDSTATGANFRYYNGASQGDAETVAGPCVSGSDRYKAMVKDTVLPAVCFGSCNACLTSGVVEGWEARVELYPNPARDRVAVRLSNHFGDWRLRLLDAQGRVLLQRAGQGEQLSYIEREGRLAGWYMVEVTEANGGRRTQKLMFQ
jgi:hypothetical protein